MKLKYVIGGLVAVVFAAWAAFNFDSSKLQYSDISYASETGSRVKIKGAWVKEHGADYNSHENLFTFHLRDTADAVIKVMHSGARPNNFELAESVVVEGEIRDGVLHSNHILTKCPSKYEGSISDVQQAGSSS